MMMVTLYYWSTLGWIKHGRFETEYAAKHFANKYPRKSWKIQSQEYQDNVIR